MVYGVHGYIKTDGCFSRRVLNESAIICVWCAVWLCVRCGCVCGVVVCAVWLCVRCDVWLRLGDELCVLICGVVGCVVSVVGGVA